VPEPTTPTTTTTARPAIVLRPDPQVVARLALEANGLAPSATTAPPRLVEADAETTSGGIAVVAVLALAGGGTLLLLGGM